MLQKSAHSLKSVFEMGATQSEVVVRGWIRSIRKGKKFSFMMLNDGSTQDSIQIIIDETLSNYAEVSSLLIGSSIEVRGKVVASQGKGQSIEIQGSQAYIFCVCDETYPIQKKATSLEFLREVAHLRARTNTFAAVFRVRHALSFATHEFFNQRGFYNLHTPIVTGVDAEGAGEMFSVTNFNLESPARSSDGKIDFSQDFFGKQTSLTVSGQLEAETFALGLGKVYTFGPTFRAENSNTARHLAEFWMIEPEVAFADLDDVAELGADYIKYLINTALSRCPQEMEFLAGLKKEEGEDLLGVLKHVAGSDFVRITYTEAVEILKSTSEKFEYAVEWGKELQAEHERYLAERHFNLPVIVTDYPKNIKAFYMKQNADGKTVRAMDILVPGIGEIIGGSQREDDHEKLLSRVREMGMHEQSLWWYLDLRKYGSVPHAGFGLGFERAVMYITGMKNIRDVIPFPRAAKSAEF